MAARQKLKKAGKSPQKASVKFHREIYKEAAIKAAALAYSDFASFSFSSQGEYIKADITRKKGSSLENLEDEFVNMALFNSI